MYEILDERDNSRRQHVPNPQDPGMEVVHLLRAATVELTLHSARFASRNGMHPTDVRALIALMDASRAGEEMTAGRLGAALGLNSAGTTALGDRLERAGQGRRGRGPPGARRGGGGGGRGRGGARG